MLSHKDQFQIILDLLPVGVVQFDRDLRLTYANAQFLEMARRPTTDVLGKSLSDLGVHWQADWRPSLQKVFSTQKPVTLDYLTSGQPQELLQLWFQPELSSGSVESILVMVLANNKVRDLRQALQTQSDLFATFMDNGPMLAWMRNSQGKYVYANAFYLQHYCLTPDLLYGTTVDDHWPVDIAANLRANDAKVTANGQPVRFYEHTPDLDGTVRTWMSVKFPFRAQDGGDFIGGMAIDVTEQIKVDEERRSLERKVLQTEKFEQLTQFANGVANDFNNQLTAILGSTTLARMRPENTIEYLDRIEAAAHRAADICQQMLQLTHRTIAPETILDLNVVLGDLVGQMGGFFAKRTRLIFRPGTSQLRIACEIEPLKQTVQDLITKAAESNTQPGSTVWLSTGDVEYNASELQSLGIARPLATGRFAFLDVALQPDHEPRVNDFVPHHRTGNAIDQDQTFPNAPPAIQSVQGIILTQAATHANRQFRLLLPLVVQSPAAVLPARPAGVRNNAEVAPLATILVVDDEEDVREIAQKTLEFAGYRVLMAADGQEALNLFELFWSQIDLVLLDLAMPQLAGPAVFQKLRQRVPTLKVILMSGHAPKEAVSVFAPKELSGFLRKPFGSDELLAVVSEGLREAIAVD